MISLLRGIEGIPGTLSGDDRLAWISETLRGKLSGELDAEGSSRFFTSSRWKPAKNQLKVDAYGKCAFCESPTSAAYYGDVEHYRPKSPDKYWWLAYCYENYLFSCRLCNGAKSDHFPRSGTPLPAPNPPADATDAQLRAIARVVCPDTLDDAAVDGFAQQSLAEDAHIPFPYHEDPEQYFAWSADDTLLEVEVRARSSVFEDYLDAAVRFLDLNREDLKRQRYRTYAQLRQAKSIFDASADHAVRALAMEMITEATQPWSPYAGMARYFAFVEWGL